MTRAFSRAALLLAAMLLVSSVGLAQNLQRVTVTAFALSADTLLPRVGVPFHLVVTLRVRERVSSVENLQLPLLAGLQLLGDVRTSSASGRGTLYRETITLAAQQEGALAIPPATFDAIDARDGRAKQYSTNALSLRVYGAPRTISAMLVAKVLISLGVSIMVLGLALAIVLARKRAPPPAPEPEPEPEPPVAAPLPADPVAEARSVLERDPTRRGALAARSLVWRMVGASDGETLADVMERVRYTYPQLGTILPPLERAAFTYDGDIHGAVDAALAALRREA